MLAVVGVTPSSTTRSPSSALMRALFPALNSPTTTSRKKSSSCRIELARVVYPAPWPAGGRASRGVRPAVHALPRGHARLRGSAPGTARSASADCTCAVHPSRPADTSFHPAAWQRSGGPSGFATQSVLQPFHQEPKVVGLADDSENLATSATFRSTAGMLSADRPPSYARLPDGPVGQHFPTPRNLDRRLRASDKRDSV